MPFTPSTTEDLIAQFLAKGGSIQTAPTGIAYGVDKDADRIKREAERDRLEAERSLQECERHAESIREGYHTGGRRGAMDAFNASGRGGF